MTVKVQTRRADMNTKSARYRHLRRRLELHRGKAAQCIWAAGEWRMDMDRVESSALAFRSCIAMARDSSRMAQRALRELRELENHNDRG